MALQKAKVHDTPDVKNRQLCVKDLPAEETTFGVALKTTLSAELLKGEFKLGGDIRLKTISLAAYWPSVYACLGSWCMEPLRFEDDAEINLSLNSSSAQKEKSLSFRRLEPSACPCMDVGNVGEPHTLKHLNAQQGLTLRKSAASNEGVQGRGQDCKHPPSRILAMAGFTDLPDVKWLGKHFQSLIETRRRVDQTSQRGSKNYSAWHGIFHRG